MGVEIRPQALTLWHDVTLDLAVSMTFGTADGDPPHGLSRTPPHAVQDGELSMAGLSSPAPRYHGQVRAGRATATSDRRNVVIQRTVKGSLAVERLGDLVLARVPRNCRDE
jgi:hypothetical protein